MKNIILLALISASAFFIVSCSSSDSTDAFVSDDLQSADIEIITPAFILFYTEN